MENCLSFVLRVVRYGRGDYVLVRKSHWGWFPHFAAVFEMADGSMIKMEYVPDGPRRRWLPPLFFKGSVVTTVYRVETVNGEPRPAPELGFEAE